MTQIAPSDIVVETSGGIVVAIYSRDRATRVVLVDWDEYEDEGRPGVRYPIDAMQSMPAETRRLVDNAL